MTLAHENFHDAAKRLAELLRDNAGQTPRYFIHCTGGFQLEELFDETPKCFQLRQFQELPQTSDADGEAPRMLCGNCHELSIVVQIGSWRLADGHGILPELLPVAAAHAAAIPNALFVDCALSLNPDLKAGRWGMLTDFINGFQFSPLDGLHHLLERPYPNLSETLNQYQNSEIINALGETDETPLLGTYLGRPGFHLPTPAETRLAAAQGADLLGHDLPLLLVFAHAMNLRVSSLVLAGAQLEPGAPAPRLDRRDFLETARFRSPQLAKTLRRAIAELEHRPHDAEPDATNPQNHMSNEPDADELIAAGIRSAATRISPLAKYLKR